MGHKNKHDNTASSSGTEGGARAGREDSEKDKRPLREPSLGRADALGSVEVPVAASPRHHSALTITHCRSHQAGAGAEKRHTPQTAGRRSPGRPEEAARARGGTAGQGQEGRWETDA